MAAGPTETGTVPGPKVFITYRREETAAHAGRLYDAMVARFGERNVFMDVDMAPGIDFVERITEAVAACQVLIVVMGPRWATVEDEHGKARIADPEDFVRLEVETGLRRPDVTPIPVLVSGARMPRRKDLPPEIQAITRRNALELSDQRWRHDIGRLIGTLDELLADVDHVPGVEAAPLDAPRPPAQAMPPSTAAAGRHGEMPPAASPTRAGRWLRSPLPAAIAIALLAIAAIVVAIVVFSDGDGSSESPAPDLRDLVLPPTAGPGDLVFSADLSGDVNPEDVGLPSDTRAAAYGNIFVAKDESSQPYWYSESIAADFEDENAAQVALALLKGNNQDETAAGRDATRVEEISAEGLGDEAFAFFYTGVGKPANFTGSWEGSTYLYLWRTGTILQGFELDLSGPVDLDTARGFADAMASLSAG